MNSRDRTSLVSTDLRYHLKWAREFCFLEGFCGGVIFLLLEFVYLLIYFSEYYTWSPNPIRPYCLLRNLGLKPLSSRHFLRMAIYKVGRLLWEPGKIKNWSPALLEKGVAQVHVIPGVSSCDHLCMERKLFPEVKVTVHPFGDSRLKRRPYCHSSWQEKGRDPVLLLWSSCDPPGVTLLQAPDLCLRIRLHNQQLCSSSNCVALGKLPSVSPFCGLKMGTMVRTHRAFKWVYVY